MIRSFIPFNELTRIGGTPQMVVSRIPMLLHGQQLAVGEVVPIANLPRPRVRQLYEQRRIQPVVAPVGSVQAVIEKKTTSQTAAPVKVVKAAPTTPSPSLVTSIPGGASPVKPVPVLNYIPRGRGRRSQ